MNLLEKEVVVVLRERGECTVKQIAEASGPRHRNLRCLVDQLCRMKRKGLVVQPQQRYWAATTRATDQLLGLSVPRCAQ